MGYFIEVNKNDIEHLNVNMDIIDDYLLRYCYNVPRDVTRALRTSQDILRGLLREIEFNERVIEEYIK